MQYVCLGCLCYTCMKMEEIKQSIHEACQELFDADIEPIVTRTQEQFGDYATNVAMQLAGKLGKSPQEIAQTLSERLSASQLLTDVSVAGPGFINIRLTDEALIRASQAAISKPLAGQTVVAEYSDPNPFKVLHAGHLYTSVVGDAIANLLEVAGASVHRVNFGGDVGLHVAKTMWAILGALGGENSEALDAIPKEKRAEWLSERYIEGNNAYDERPDVKEAVILLNHRVYELHNNKDKNHDTAFAKIYWTTRTWSYDYFDDFYARIGSKFERYYPESETAPIGLATVREQLQKGVYKESDGAVVFDGESHGLHTRVFINSEGLPTYEAKDVGLIMAKWRDYKFDRSVIITGNDIVEYMKVVLKSIEQFEPKLAQATTHLTHGIVKLAGGVKMSSRKGNILKAVDVLNAAARANKQVTGKENDQVVLGAVKYAFLKQRMGGDIMYSPEDSVSLEGNSGPYLQYAYTRAHSILAKVEKVPGAVSGELEAGERSLVRKLSEYPEVVQMATKELMPHHITTYLYELAQTFNRFYEDNKVVGSDREATRLAIVGLYAKKLKDGLELLGIPVLERM